MDWDVQIRLQLRGFARATHALTQPVSSGPATYTDPTYPSPPDESSIPPDMHFNRLPHTLGPRQSLYSDDWDVLWLGHCGTRFPNIRLEQWREGSKRIPRGRVVFLKDDTVPEKDYLKLLSEDDDPRESYPFHTRVVHQPMGTQYSLAYTVTQASARQILYSAGIKVLTGPFDIMLKERCDGVNGREYLTCITVQPQLFHHHRPAGTTSSCSDIADHSNEILDQGHTRNIRWSTKMNLPKLMKGETDYFHEYPDKVED